MRIKQRIYAVGSTARRSSRVVVLAAVAGLLIAACGDDGGQASTSEQGTAPETTAAATESTEVSDEDGADKRSDSDVVVIEASAVSAPLSSYSGDAAPFDDGTVEAHWYQWGDTHVVVYAGWDATDAGAQCPGTAFENEDGFFDYLSNSPTAPSACDPEEVFTTERAGAAPPVLIPLDDELGVRACDTLVLYHTIIPITVDGQPIVGTLYGAVDRIVDAGFVGSSGMVEADTAALTELDPNADAYSVPDGWLPDGSTEVAC